MQWYNYVVGFPSAKIEVIAKSGLVAYGYGLMALDLGDHENFME